MHNSFSIFMKIIKKHFIWIPFYNMLLFCHVKSQWNLWLLWSKMSAILILCPLFSWQRSEKIQVCILRLFSASLFLFNHPPAPNHHQPVPLGWFLRIWFIQFDRWLRKRALTEMVFARTLSVCVCVCVSESRGRSIMARPLATSSID